MGEKEEIVSLLEVWMEMEDIMLSKRSQTQKDKYSFSLSVESKLEKKYKNVKECFLEKKKEINRF